MKLFLYISLLLFTLVIATPAKNRNQREIIENKEFDTFIRKLDTYPIGTDIRKMKDDPVIGKYLIGTHHLIQGYPKSLYNAYKKIYTNPKM
ncbi:MAG: hypothetical protein RML49_07935, partial [Verrucomicrobiae bacterium]|nr:hypothetical protein [Verrucomicrobiae bacterium]